MRKFISTALLLASFLLVSFAELPALDLKITAYESDGFTRRNEPVSTGVILPRGEVTDISALSLFDNDGKAVSSQYEALSTWPDGSVKWLLVDFEANCPPKSKSAYYLRDKAADVTGSKLSVEKNDSGVTVSTGVMKATLSDTCFNLFESVYLDHNGDGTFSSDELVSLDPVMPGVSLTTVSGGPAGAKFGQLKSFEVEDSGPVRVTVAVKGEISYPSGMVILEYIARINFYAGTGFVEVNFSLENPHAAQPYENGGGHWLMGDNGSVLFEDMSLTTRLGFGNPIVLSVCDLNKDILDRMPLNKTGGIYQESSGGDNWYTRIHINRNGDVPMTFKGAKTFIGSVEPYKVDRPDAWIEAADRQFGLAVGVRNFWQNFPKALTVNPDGTVRVSLWPEEFPDVHELQGGERKTHQIAFYFHTGDQESSINENRVATVMCGFMKPLLVRATAESYLASGFFDDASVYDPKRFPTYEKLCQSGVVGKNGNQFDDIDRMDEYGWRNFGDTPAMNEFDETGGPSTGRRAASHFNHEYDHGFGMIFQHLRTFSAAPDLSQKWWQLGAPAILHESDIDTYHCIDDTLAGGVFGGAKFSHTGHGVEVSTGTHRQGSPGDNMWGKLDWPWGRGLSPESGHFNNRGMMAYYYLTGDKLVKETASQMADLVRFKISNDNFAQIDRVTRDAGNNLQILTDEYLLTWNEDIVPLVEKILVTTAPEKQWYMSEEGRREHPDDTFPGFWQPSICINAVARWTSVMEEKTGKPYQKGRDYITAYADFASRFVAGGPDHGFYSYRTPAGEKRGNFGPWTYRISDVLMFGHKYSNDSDLKKRCLKATQDAFTFMARRYKNREFIDSKSHTMILGGGHEYTYFKSHGKWNTVAK